MPRPCIGGVFCLLVVFPLEICIITGNGISASMLFTAQPENRTAQEGTTITFRCAINNASFGIFWYVNSTDASYTRLQHRGISIIRINQTSSLLAVNASRNNNNTYIHCTAVLFDPLIEFSSEKALLVVEAISKKQISLVSVVTYTSTKGTPSHSIRSRSRSLLPSVWIGTAIPKQQPSHISATRTLTPANNSTRSISPPPEADELPKESEQKQRFLIAVISVPIVGSVLIIVCLSIVVILARKRCQSGDQKRDSTTETIKMAPNIPYEYRQPMKCKINTAYDDVKLHATTSPHPH